MSVGKSLFSSRKILLNRALFFAAFLALSIFGIPEVESQPIKNKNINKNEKYRKYFYKTDIKWIYDIIGEGDQLGVAVGMDKTIFYGSEKKLYAFNPNGSVKWTSYVTGAGSPLIGPDGTIYLAMYPYGALPQKGIIAVDSSGRTKWAFNTQGFVRQMGAIDSDGSIYFGCDDDCLYALFPYGELKWKYKTEGNVSSPAIDSESNIYFNSMDGHIYSLTSDGVLRWKYFLGKYSGYEDPIICGENDICTYVSGDKIVCILSRQGDLKKKVDIDGGLEGYLTVGIDGTIYLNSIGRFYAIDPENGRIKWRYLPNAWWGGPQSIDANGVTYFSSGALLQNYWTTILHAINNNGAINWQYNFGKVGNGNCPAIENDGTLYIGFWSLGNSWLYAFNTQSKGIADSNWPKYKHDNMNTNCYKYKLTYPLPPINFNSWREEDKSLFSKEYINVLTWEENVLNNGNIIAYRIYEIDDSSKIFLGEIGKDVFTYFCYKVSKEKKYIYAISSVDGSGKEGMLSYALI